MRRISWDQQKGMQDTLPQIVIRCVFHPSNKIQNFCRNQQCLLPMCATCIGQHNSEHNTDGTFGQYLNIEDAAREVRDELDRGCKTLKQYSEEYTADYSNKEKMIAICKRQLEEIREKVVRELDKSLATIEKNVIEQLQQFENKSYKKYCEFENEMEHLYDSMKIQLNAINNQDKVLKSLIAFHSDSQSQKIKEWLTFFAERIHGLKKELIKLDLDTSIYKDIGELGKYVKVVEFEGETMDYSLAGKSLKSKSQQSRSQQSKSSNSSQSSLPH